MKKLTFLGVLFIALILGACGVSNDKRADTILSGDKPPNVVVKINGEKYETVLGTYCWEISSTGDKKTGECVDTAGPVDLLKDKEPIIITAGEEVTLNMDYTPKPNEMHLSQVKSDNDEMEIEVKDNQFIAPNEKGIYFYSYGVWWMDEEDKDLSHGDAFYAFSLEVK